MLSGRQWVIRPLKLTSQSRVDFLGKKEEPPYRSHFTGTLNIVILLHSYHFLSWKFMYQDKAVLVIKTITATILYFWKSGTFVEVLLWIAKNSGNFSFITVLQTRYNITLILWACDKNTFWCTVCCFLISPGSSTAPGTSFTWICLCPSSWELSQSSSRMVCCMLRKTATTALYTQWVITTHYHK